MIKKRNKTGLLLAATAVILIGLLGYRILSGIAELEDLGETINKVEGFIRSPASANVPTTTTDDIPRRPGSGEGPGRPEDWVFNGLSFYDLKELDRFFVEKIRETSSAFEVHPPRDLRGVSIEEGIKLEWRRNPLNSETIKKLAGNPLLQLRYKIYRWTKASQPAVIARLSSQVDEFLDREISPSRVEYYYSVLLALEGTTGDDRIIIESERSDIISIVSRDRFTIRVTGSDENAAYVTVTIKAKGRYHTESFRVAIGEKIGAVREVSGAGPLDFSTGLILKAVRLDEEEREIVRKIPVFNSDGSITIDSSTQEPIYRESSEIRPVPVISIDCLDSRGKTRVFKES